MTLRILTIAAAFALGTPAAFAATPTNPTDVTAFEAKDGGYVVTIGGQEEAVPTDSFCASRNEVEFESDNNPGFTFTVVHDVDAGELKIGRYAVDFKCPPSFEVAALRAALADQAKDYGWDKAVINALLKAVDDGSFEERTVKVNANSTHDWGGFWSSPYGKRWSEGNFFLGHIRDEHPEGAKVVVVTVGDRRYTVLLDDCGDIEKIAVGKKPVAVARQAKPAKRVVTRRVVIKPDPAPVAAGKWVKISHRSTMNCWGRGTVPRGEFRYKMCNGHWTRVKGGSLSKGTHRQAWKWVGTGRPRN